MKNKIKILEKSYKKLNSDVLSLRNENKNKNQRSNKILLLLQEMEEQDMIIEIFRNEFKNDKITYNDLIKKSFDNKNIKKIINIIRPQSREEIRIEIRNLFNEKIKFKQKIEEITKIDENKFKNISIQNTIKSIEYNNNNSSNDIINEFKIIQNDINIKKNIIKNINNILIDNNQLINHNRELYRELKKIKNIYDIESSNLLDLKNKNNDIEYKINDFKEKISDSKININQKLKENIIINKNLNVEIEKIKNDIYIINHKNEEYNKQNNENKLLVSLNNEKNKYNTIKNELIDMNQIINNNENNNKKKENRLKNLKNMIKTTENIYYEHYNININEEINLNTDLETLENELKTVKNTNKDNELNEICLTNDIEYLENNLILIKNKNIGFNLLYNNNFINNDIYKKKVNELNILINDLIIKKTKLEKENKHKISTIEYYKKIENEKNNFSEINSNISDFYLNI